MVPVKVTGKTTDNYNKVKRMDKTSGRMPGFLNKRGFSRDGFSSRDGSTPLTE